MSLLLGAGVKIAGEFEADLSKTITYSAMTGLIYNPLTRQFKLQPRDVSVNYMVRAVKPE